MDLLWKLSDKGTHVKFCWIPNHCGIEGNKVVDKLAKKSLDLDIDNLLGIYHADLKHHVNTYVQQLMQVKLDVEVHRIDLYLLKANLAPPDRYEHLKRAEEVATLSPVDPQQSATTVAAHYQENTYYSNVPQSKNSVMSSTKQIPWLSSFSAFVP